MLCGLLDISTDPYTLLALPIVEPSVATCLPRLGLPCGSIYPTTHQYIRLSYYHMALYMHNFKTFPNNLCSDTNLSRSAPNVILWD